ncbi:hypothetical protein E4U60_005086 [Claviceps pazoutovae]|uniref:Uncharacterized protein n=1 Tax=Claviceps pazoutovae TaxID=1649127 RepID=A0A9P7SF40_9HYPO|nr:hypothetical protein E4U60_005086 [Claviceps pazoutovae]
MVFGERRRKHGKADGGWPSHEDMSQATLFSRTVRRDTQRRSSSEMHWLRLAKPGEELGKELGTSSRQMTAGWTDANNARNCLQLCCSWLPIVAAAEAEKGRVWA